MRLINEVFSEYVDKDLLDIMEYPTLFYKGGGVLEASLFSIAKVEIRVLVVC